VPRTLSLSRARERSSHRPHIKKQHNWCISFFFCESEGARELARSLARSLSHSSTYSSREIYFFTDSLQRADGHRGATSEEGAAHREGYEFDPKSSKSGLPLHAHPLTHTPHNPPHLAHLPPAAHAPMECSSKVTVWAVGDCAVRDQPLAVLEQRCSSDPPAAVDEFKALLKQQVAEYRQLTSTKVFAYTSTKVIAYTSTQELAY
jgi:hypothetical protein